jgi:hypothetical protein
MVVSLAGCSPQAAEPEVVTVVNTVPVEVTRLVEVEKTVVVTQEVVVTQVVEVPVTVMPTATAESAPATETAVPTTVIPAYTEVPVTATIDPNEFKDNKSQGFAPLKITNESGNTIVVEVSGPQYFAFTVGKENSILQVVPEADYSYTVLRDGEVLFTGTLHITNPDKHELVVRSDKAIFKVP